jgi:hypothetical protein
VTSSRVRVLPIQHHYRHDTQAQINSKIKMKLLEMDRVKAVWNKYAANKITVTIIKSWKEAMI